MSSTKVQCFKSSNYWSTVLRYELHGSMTLHPKHVRHWSMLKHMLQIVTWKSPHVTSTCPPSAVSGKFWSAPKQFDHHQPVCFSIPKEVCKSPKLIWTSSYLPPASCYLLMPGDVQALCAVFLFCTQQALQSLQDCVSSNSYKPASHAWFPGAWQ